SMNAPRYQHTATRLTNGTVLVTGGFNATDFLASAEIYDPKKGLWTNTGSMHVPRGGHTASLLPDGSVLGTGGGGVGAASETYNPANGVWSFTGTPTVLRVSHSATVLPSGKVLVTGGLDETHAAVACDSE